MRLVAAASAFLLLAMLAGCSSVDVKTDYDPDVDFSKYKTYAWVGDSGVIEGSSLADYPLVAKRVAESVNRDLKARGFAMVDDPENADFAVVIHAGTQEKMQVTNYGGYSGYYSYDPWWGPYGGHTDVSYYTEGTLVIDFVDVGTKELAWRGLGTAIVKGYSTPEDAQKNIDKVVDRILAGFPPK
ncbi:MAG: DUF4136 domain-containing protein [bacterium]